MTLSGTTNNFYFAENFLGGGNDFGDSVKRKTTVRFTLFAECGVVPFSK